MDSTIAQVNQILTSPQTIDPDIPLVERTKNWIAILYSKAEELVWQEHKDEPAEFAPWKLLDAEERQAAAIESLDEEKRDWWVIYHSLCDEKALQIADGLTEAIRASITEIIKNQQRKRLRWQKIKGYDKVKEIAKQTIQLPPGSAGRQISSFLENHLDIVEEAQVPEETALTLLSKPDKFTIVTARAISRVKSSELGNEEKLEKVREIVTYASETQYASDVRKKFLNGHYSIPRDIITSNGQTYITFVPANEDEVLVLTKRTNDISVQYGNPQPILAETQAMRTRQNTLLDTKMVLSLLISEDLTLERIRDYVEQPEDIIRMLEELGSVIITEEGNYHLTF